MDIGDQVLAAIRDAEDGPEPETDAPVAVVDAPEVDEFEAAAIPPPAEPEEEDRSDWITVNGHQYRDQDAVFQALEAAQKYISSGQHKQPEPEPQPQQQEFVEAPRPLLGTGAPLGGAPGTEQELVDWAMADVANATKWAMANQDRVRPELVSQLWNAWQQTNPAETTAFTLQWQKAQSDAANNELIDRISEMLMPVIQRDRESIARNALEEARKAPGFQQYETQVWEQIANASDEYHQWFETLSPDAMVQELRDVYAGLRGQMWLKSQMGVAVPAGQAAAPAAMQAAPPNNYAAVTSTSSAAGDAGGNGFDESALQLEMLNHARRVLGQPELTEMPE